MLELFVQLKELASYIIDLMKIHLEVFDVKCKQGLDRLRNHLLWVCDVCYTCVSVSLSVCLSVSDWLALSLSPSAHSKISTPSAHSLHSFLRTRKTITVSCHPVYRWGTNSHYTITIMYKWFGLFVQTCVPQWFLVTTANNMPGNLVSGWTHLWVFPYIFTLLLILCMCVCL